MVTETRNYCSGCLATDRQMLLIQNKRKEHCFLQIIKEFAVSHQNDIQLWLCWECEANVARFNRFKLQVKRSYLILQDSVTQKNIPQHKPKYIIQQVVNISVNDSESIKPETIPDVPIKNEQDFSDEDNAFLIELSSEKPEDKDGKIIKNKKIRKKIHKKSIKTQIKYKEVDLTNVEIEDERKQMKLRDDYVNAMFRCEQCIITFANEDDMKEHVYKKHELHKDAYKCAICTCAFASEVAYRYHARRHMRRHACAECHVRTNSKVAILTHWDNSHARSYIEQSYKRSTLQENGTKSIDKFPCDICTKVFKWKTSLRKHVETHRIEAGHKRKPYCEPCSLAFSTTANLQKHVKCSSKHQIQLKLRKLKEANPGLSDEKQIAEIKSSVNSKVELFACTQCDRKFQWRGNLRRHEESHAARSAGALVCVPCGRNFSSVATYRQHMRLSRRHVSDTEFKYMCGECGKKFANKTKLKDHVDWDHLKNYVHSCGQCRKVFKSHTSLYLHRQTAHGALHPDHLCETCGKAFPTVSKLRAHVSARHSGAALVCGECGARFAWHSCLSRHRRRAHRDLYSPTT